MMRGFTRRGQPLLALVLVLGGWVSARAMMWDGKALPAVRAPAAAGIAAAARQLDDWASEGDAAVLFEGDGPVSVPAGELALHAGPPTLAGAIRRGSGRRGSGRRGSGESAPEAGRGAFIAPPAEPLRQLPPMQFALPLAPPPAAVLPVPARIAAGHQMLWMAALANIPLPPGLAALQPSSAAPLPFYPPGHETLRASSRRWSADGWLLWRRGSRSAPAGGLLTPSYGASQAGVVLRYRLAPDSSHRPAVYLRTTAALNGSSEREVALGLSARPFGGVPVVLSGEARLTSTPGRRIVRPAVFAVTELPPFALPFGFRGEAYGQGGYVGGSFATAFADGQLRVDRSVLTIGGADMRAGGGAWGGIQKGASRVDAGPALTIGRPLGGPASMRLSADWRFRVAGKAAPGSGPAVTLSAGF